MPASVPPTPLCCPTLTRCPLRWNLTTSPPSPPSDQGNMQPRSGCLRSLEEERLPKRHWRMRTALTTWWTPAKVIWLISYLLSHSWASNSAERGKVCIFLSFSVVLTTLERKNASGLLKPYPNGGPSWAGIALVREIWDMGSMKALVSCIAI